MKIHEIRKKYGFNQNTFYGWLRNEGLIQKTAKGYEIGVNALEGMETFSTSRVDENGEVIENTQVIVKDDFIQQIVEQYSNSGLNKIYSSTKNKEVISLEKELELANYRIDILQEQLAILTNEVKILTQLLEKFI